VVSGGHHPSSGRVRRHRGPARACEIVGKTAIAVQWANQVQDRFPDGQLYLDMRGFGPGDPVQPDEALQGFITALGGQIPGSVRSRQALREIYVGLIWSKRLLLVLDNARDENQVRPLLPPSGSSLTLITSRNRFSDLNDVYGITVDLMPDPDAEALIMAYVGTDRAHESPVALRQIIDQCARLPLALTIAAATAAEKPDVPLGRVVDEIRRSRRVFSVDQSALPGRTESVFNWPYRALSNQAARAFRLLSLHPSRPFRRLAAASAVGLGDGEIDAVLGELVRVHMLFEPRPGIYVFHDLLLEFSIRLRQQLDTESAVNEARRRLLDHYLHAAYAASVLVNPLRSRPKLPRAMTGVQILAFPQYEDAAAWIDSSYLVLLDMVRIAYEAGSDTHAWQLSGALTDSFDRNAHWQELAIAMRTARTAAARSHSAIGEALSLRWLGRAHLKLGETEAARSDFTMALQIFARIKDAGGQALTLHNLALVEESLGQHAEALTWATRSVPLYRAAGDVSGEARGINAVGWYKTLLGRHEEAIALCQEAREILQTIGDRHGLADTLDSLGHAYLRLGRLDLAIERYQAAIAQYSEIGTLMAEAESLGYLGEAYLADGQADRAEEAWRHAMHIKSESGLVDSDLVERLHRLESDRRGHSLRAFLARFRRRG
jgi:tetratricopeptide (TPR) repeat protein